RALRAQHLVFRNAALKRGPPPRFHARGFGHIESLESIKRKFLVADAIALIDEIEIVLGNRHQVSAAKTFKGASLIDQITFSLNDPFARDGTRAAQQWNIRGERQFARLAIAICHLLAQLLRGTHDPARLDIAAKRELLSHAK